jgi:hypothetical protein
MIKQMMVVMMVVTVCSACAHTMTPEQRAEQAAIQAEWDKCNTLEEEGVYFHTKLKKPYHTQMWYVLMEDKKTLCFCTKTRPSKMNIDWKLVQTSCVPGNL